MKYGLLLVAFWVFAEDHFERLLYEKLKNAQKRQNISLYVPRLEIQYNYYPRLEAQHGFLITLSWQLPELSAPVGLVTDSHENQE